MKKYLISAAAAMALGGILSGCTHDEMTTSAASQDILEKYADVFTTAFGTPAPTQSWGFAESSNTIANTRGLTRGVDKNLPTNPTFSDKDDITKPTKPTTRQVFYNTVEAAKNAGAKYATEKFSSRDIIYIDEAYYSSGNNEWSPSVDSKNNLTICLDGNITFHGTTSQNGNGTIICVTENSTVTLKNVRNKLTVYLAPNAKLKLSDATFNNGDIFMSNGSELKANTLTMQYGSIINNGGTINASNLNFDNSSDLWNEGTITVTGELKTVNENTHIYNDNGKEITASKLLLNKNVTVWNEGKIDISNNLECINESVKIYNATDKTIEAGSLELKNNYDLIVNDGTLTISGAINMSNNAPEIVNNGTLSGASLEMLAGAMMHNTGTTTIAGKTHIANTNSKWKNEGQYTTGDFEISDYAEQVYNNCKLTVHKADYTGEFKIYGKFVLDGAASVITDTFNWINNSYFFLKDKSLLKVIGTFLTQNKDINGGLYGCGNEYAVVQAGSITHNGNEQYRMSYYGNLYIATDSHFTQWYKDDKTNQPCYYYDDTVKFGFNDAVDSKVKKTACPVTIPYNERCNPGFEGGGGTDPDPDVVRIIAEDLTWGTENGDFDFNDVVFDVRLSEDKQTITITLKAAGGTLPLRIAGEYEVHDKFGVPTGTIVNTRTNLSTSKSDVTWSFENIDKRNYQLVNGQEVYHTYGNTVKEVAYNLPVEVQKLVNGSKSWVELTAPVGKAAAKLAVDNTYNWCDERQSVDERYYDNARSRGKFSMYVKKEEPYAEDNSWYK